MVKFCFSCYERTEYLFSREQENNSSFGIFFVILKFLLRLYTSTHLIVCWWCAFTQNALQGSQTLSISQTGKRSSSPPSAFRAKVQKFSTPDSERTGSRTQSSPNQVVEMVSYDTPGQREYMQSRHEISMMEEFAVHSAIFSAAPLHFRSPPPNSRCSSMPADWNVHRQANTGGHKF